jgi:acetylornithine deacetylase/succinyl-diaminopimelate desuccinylase-like protein
VSKHLLTAISLAAALTGANTQAQQQPGEAAFRALYKEMAETDSSVATGSCTAVVDKLAARMKAAGFPEKDLHAFIPPQDKRAGILVAVFPGADPKAKAVLMLGHIDVVNAKREDWTRDPFILVEENGSFYARGVSDMKSQDAIWADNMIRFHQEGYKPRRTIKMALTCGEEGGGFVNGAAWLSQNQRELIDAGIALNEGGSGEIDANGKRIVHTVMAADKTSSSFILEATNPGGHSSRPRPDNAIFELAKALTKVSTINFPIELNDANRPYFVGMASVVGGKMGEAMLAVVKNPADEAAGAVLDTNEVYRAMARVTCTATLLEGGHASNALPQRARATINCRLLPTSNRDAVYAAIVKAVEGADVKVIAPTTPPGKASMPTLTPAVMDPIRKISQQVWPGVPVLPMQLTGGTDARHLIAVGIPTFGVDGLFRDPDGGNMHGLNEHIAVQSVMDARTFLYRLVKAYAEQKD